MCSILSISTSCKITCDFETGFHHCIINYEPSSDSNMEQPYISITFANDHWEVCRCDAGTNTNITFADNHLLNNWYPCSCNFGNFTPINCFIMRPTPTMLLSNTEVLPTTIPFSTTTVTNISIVSVVVPAVLVTTLVLLCISVAIGSALLCAFCMKKRKQDLATLHSDSKDQQKYSA